jgi:hypothetical protein
VLDGGSSTTAVPFKQQYKIKDEGTYITYFFFAKRANRIPARSIVDPEGILENTEDLGDELFSIFDNDSRRLRASNEFNLTSQHLMISGSISFQNSYGYLQADIYPLLSFY